MTTTQSSEYEPLIESTNPFYDEVANKPAESKRVRSYSTRIFLFFTVLLLVIGVAVYELIPRQPLQASPSSLTPPSGGKYNWLRAEATHQHSAHVPKSWAEKEECDEEHPFILTLALKQQNTEALHEHVAAVSHPRNKATFHKYWAADDVRSYFKPSDEAIAAVTAWLKENDFTTDNGKIDMVSKFGNVLRVSLTCGQANKLLNTKYMFYENVQNGNRHLRVKDGVYNVPDVVHEHIDFVSPTIRFPLQHHTLTVQTMDKKTVDFLKSHTKDGLRQYYNLDKDGNKKKKDDGEEGETNEDSSNIIPNIPSKLYELYDMTESVETILGDNDLTSMDSSTCRQSIASFIEQYYSDEDISLFWEDLDVYPESEMQRVPVSQPEGYGSEAELDTQYITSTGKGIYTYVYYIDSDDIFVSLAEAILDTEVPPLVVSISYGADEYELGETWVTRCNEEFGKLALIGTTVLASSGDSGVRGNDDDCYFGEFSSIFEEEEEEKEDKKRGRKLLKSISKGSGSSKSSSSSSSDEYQFVASFPASAPYVTAVGGTEGGTIQDDVADSTGETAWLYSGGGFSIYFPAPEWQSNAISSYLNNADIELPDSSRYEATGRAYPDISAQSVDYVIAYDSAFYLVSGTSASSPTVAGMISMINYARISAGKSSLGFLNPALYSLYDEDQSYYFNDIVEGYNIGCEVDDDIGFYAAEGYDPLTGVGTPKFSRLYQALLAMD
eukprot:CAMPEP_0197074278 /NCGR_PEP_ID=MMETSP1384-20130603/211028_1 /TAXON_ID=29189 /ORGANISM="Ammonia sp." /LENGTH=723 /DNA_ID=CAMNT_0042513119 /DNA_START=106 /DNA_END=2277 /DNA_ORIENTATION=-